MTEPVKTAEELTANLTRAMDKQAACHSGIYNRIALKLESVDFENKAAVFSHVTTEYELNFRGNMHGGVVCWIADTCMGSLSCAFGRTDNPTLEMNVRFLKAICPGDKILIKTSIDHVGGHIITPECKIFIARDDGSEVLAATAGGSFYRLDPK